MTETDSLPQAPQRVECPAAKDPAVRLFILAAMLVGFGVWCFIEGVVHKKYPYEAGDDINALLNHVLNVYGGFVLVPLGLVAAVWGVVFLRRTLVADEAGIGYQGKEHVAWERISKLDASRLKGKGLLELHYDDAKLTLDSWKLQNFQDLVRVVEANVPEEKRAGA